MPSARSHRSSSSFQTLHASARSASEWLVLNMAIPRSWRLVGWMRLAALMVFVLSCLWTVFLTILHVAPTKTANYIMNTTQFDDGEFWQLAEADLPLMVASVVGLGSIALVYLCLSVLVLLPVRPLKRAKTKLKSEPWLDGDITKIKWARSIAQVVPRSLAEATTQATAFYRELVNQHGRYRKAWNLALEIPEITFQTMTLHNLLSQGIAPRLIHAYVVLMVVNCIYCFYRITIAWKKHAFHEMVGDAMLDVVFAIVFPAVTLLKAILDFHGGLRTMVARQLFFPAQAYERRGRLYGSPKQINLFTAAFETLQISGAMDLVVTVGFNLLTCLRWRRIVSALRNEQRRTRPLALKRQKTAARSTSISPLPLNATKRASSKTAIHASSGQAAVMDATCAKQEVPPRDARKASKRAASSPFVNAITMPTRVIPAYVGLFFLGYAAVVVLTTSMAISESSTACESLLPQCMLHSHVWYPAAPSMACPCLVYIEGSLTDRLSFDQELRDASSGLSRAAEAGSLRTIQIVNRALHGSLPPFVEGCHDLRQLIIVNCIFPELPSAWPWTFTKLQYLHITGGTRQSNLLSIPHDFFLSMASLRTLYLERHIELEALPSFQGLQRLEMFYLSGTRVARLPPFTDTPALRTLALIDNGRLTFLPDLTPVAKSLDVVHIKTTPLCCSGFLSQGTCNDSYPACFPYYSESGDENSCYPSDQDRSMDARLLLGSDRFPLISNSSRAVLQPFLDSDHACNKSLSNLIFSDLLLDVCQGVWYRKCPTGICYSYDYQAVKCQNDSTVIDMRKYEISMQLECDHEEEAWLGCLLK